MLMEQDYFQLVGDIRTDIYAQPNPNSNFGKALHPTTDNYDFQANTNYNQGPTMPTTWPSEQQQMMNNNANPDN